jgi:hypothetical protein
MPRVLAIVLLLPGLLGGLRAAEPEWRLSPKPVRDEVRAVVAAQLAALQAGDFAKAYEFAARGLRRQFDERLFAAMIRRAYAPLLQPGERDLGVVRDDGRGEAQMSVTVSDSRGRGTMYRYRLVKEPEGWRISAVLPEPRAPRGGI